MLENNAIRVLVVEDHDITRLGLRLSLEKNTAVAIIGEAKDGIQAVETAKALAPDVVLMDIGLPGIDGIEATRRIKMSLPDMRTIMFTSHDSADEVFAALSAGAEGYCLKNISADQLVRAIVSVHEGVVWLDPGVANVVLHNMSAQSLEDDKPTKKQCRFPLSPREMEVLALVVDGLSNAQIAERLFVSPETVKTHMRHLMEKLSVADRTQVAVKAIREGLLSSNNK